MTLDELCVAIGKPPAPCGGDSICDGNERRHFFRHGLKFLLQKGKNIHIIKY